MADSRWRRARPVLAGALGGVGRAVRGREEARRVGMRVVRGGRGPNRGRGVRYHRPEGDRQGRDLGAHTFRQRQGARRIGLRQERHEFIAAQAGWQVTGAQSSA